MRFGWTTIGFVMFCGWGNAALLKKQWGQNLIKYQGVKLPGGVELNGRAIYDDGVAEMQAIEDKMSTEFELPPLDFIG